MFRYFKKYLLLLAPIAAFAFALAMPVVGNSGALSGSSFNPGRIIDDSVFYNSQSMTTTQIQAFLNSKNPNCDYNGTQSAADWGYPNITHAQLAEYKRNGTNGFSRDTGFHAPPYKCLTMYTQSTPQMEAASGYCNAIPSANRSAAQIIKDVAEACGINPQVLIVLLEKEQSLITDNWPLNRQLRNATGFACPDTAPCNPAYEGFFYQVYYAARQFKVYKANPTSYNYLADRTNRIYWQTNLGNFINPSGNVNDPSRNGQSACGYQNVYIENQATAALYIYTPYQPNQSALGNLRGTGDACSAYGNRNFWRLFTDWFGSTTGAAESNIYLPNGRYSLVNQASNRGLDVEGGRSTNGNRVQIYNQNNTLAQKWDFERDSEGYYSLKNAATGKYLDVSNASRIQGAAVQIWEGNDSCAQKWAIVSSGGNAHLQNKCSGLALDVIGGKIDNGTRVQIYSKNSSGAQLWKILASNNSPTYNGFYEINTSSGLSIEIAGGNTANGTRVQLWSSNKSPSQYWQLNRQSDGLYTIRNPASGRFLDVTGGSITNGTPIHIWNGNANCPQKWTVKDNSNGTFSLLSACNDTYAADVSGGAIGINGTGIQLFKSNNSGAQSWIIGTP